MWPSIREAVRRRRVPTTHSDPTYIVDEIVHYCVTNMPGAVGRTSTYALCNVTFPYVALIAGTWPTRGE